MTKYLFFYDSPIGRIGIAENGTAITDVFLSHEYGPMDCELKETDLINEAGKQLQEYFDGKRKIFELPLAPKGTPFQEKVWKALCDIPFGETRTYGDIARAVGNHKACRAVGMANHNNPISIIIPCHRVIGSNGKLVGYGGGLPTKEYLLNLEKQYI